METPTKFGKYSGVVLDEEALAQSFREDAKKSGKSGGWLPAPRDSTWESVLPVDYPKGQNPRMQISYHREQWNSMVFLLMLNRRVEYQNGVLEEIRDLLKNGGRPSEVAVQEAPQQVASSGEVAQEAPSEAPSAASIRRGPGRPKAEK